MLRTTRSLILLVILAVVSDENAGQLPEEYSAESLNAKSERIHALVNSVGIRTDGLDGCPIGKIRLCGMRGQSFGDYHVCFSICERIWHARFKYPTVRHCMPADDTCDYCACPLGYFMDIDTNECLTGPSCSRKPVYDFSSWRNRETQDKFHVTPLNPTQNK